MSPLQLSLIISTSPGRQGHLRYCLQALTRQDRQDFEVLVIDDGSEGMEPVLAEFKGQFPLQYLWRPQDGNISHSRNLGARHSCTDRLVFLNGDILLNPRALAYYAEYLERFPGATLWGYVGCRKAYSCPSWWFENVRVNWLDFRFFPISPTELYIHPELEQRPFQLVGGHHFAVNKSVFEHSGGFNAAFTGWGEEDVEFGLRSLIQGHPIYFVGDCWAEHMEHPYDQPFHTTQAHAQLRQKLTQTLALEPLALAALQQPGLAPGVLFEGEQGFFLALMQSHYLVHNPGALQKELGF